MDRAVRNVGLFRFKRGIIPSFLAAFPVTAVLCAAVSLPSRADSVVLEAEDAALGTEVEIRTGDSFSAGLGVVRKGDDSSKEKTGDALPEISDKPVPPKTPGVSKKSGVSKTPEVFREPDIVFTFQTSEAGRYEIRSFAAGDGNQADDSGNRQPLTALMAIDDAPVKSRLIVTDRSDLSPRKEKIGKFSFSAGPTTIRFWLPKGAVLDRIRIDPYFPEKVPDSAAVYFPPILPPAERPRLWVTPALLPTIRANLRKSQNAPIWRRVLKRASSPFDPESILHGPGSSDEAARERGFVYLMTGDEKIGRESVDLMTRRLEAAEFQNSDSTREIGTMIYSAALVFDWCYPLMTDGERLFYHDAMLRFAEEMEIGWPPFAQPVVNTHGNESQLNRDLLSMAIAVYEIDPIPYQYCAYRILEELVPMRRFQFQSPRHDQGISYASYRFDWEIQGALLFQRMTGRAIYDENIKRLRDYFLFMRLPGGGMLRDGDGIADRPDWDKHRCLMMTLGSYSADPVLKGEWERLGGEPEDDVLYLLLNDPDLLPDQTSGSLPLAWDSGEILASQILRTGWDLTADSDDVIVEFKGGAYRFGNHQHSDAGAFQIFHHGFLAADLGQYHAYGTPYDYGFAKRSAAHNVLLVRDPSETFEKSPINDGGQRFFERSPWTAEEAQNDPTFRTGRRIASEIRPSCEEPADSFFAVDLTDAYSDKVENYVRSFFWLKSDDSDSSVTVIVLDRVTVADPSFRIDWQLNTLTKPVFLDEKSLTVESIPPIRPGETWPSGPNRGDPAAGRRGQMTMTTLLPKVGAFHRSLCGGADANLVDGVRLTPPKDSPEAFGWRIHVTPNGTDRTSVFLNVLQVGGKGERVPPVRFSEETDCYVLEIAGRRIELSRDGRRGRVL